MSEWPRIKDLPVEQQESFSNWLRGQTCPWINGLSVDEQDGYYPWDYQRFVKGLPIVD